MALSVAFAKRQGARAAACDVDPAWPGRVGASFRALLLPAMPAPWGAPPFAGGVVAGAALGPLPGPMAHVPMMPMMPMMMMPPGAPAYPYMVVPGAPPAMQAHMQPHMPGPMQPHMQPHMPPPHMQPPHMPGPMQPPAAQWHAQAQAQAQQRRK